ncbi:hypothetical protein KCMC57_up42540 [Kitasatospora sp. CMC57]|uniref:Uncharacterized protein n=1 Tax=Kitasatospora sp. CMC57 TaxID=3231513 RepID=A0AB33JXK8_9ACTN
MSFSGFGWLGWAPVSDVEPSPIGLPFTEALLELPLDPAAGLPGVDVPAPEPPPPEPLSPQAATAPRAAVAAVALSTVLREMLPMVSPAVVHPSVHAEKSDIDGYFSASMPRGMRALQSPFAAGQHAAKGRPAPR